MRQRSSQMKVFKCNEQSKKDVVKPHTYTGKELETTAPEGVYSLAADSRYIVFKKNYGGNIVLYLQRGILVGSADLSNTSAEFTKQEDAKVIFEIKE